MVGRYAGRLGAGIVRAREIDGLPLSRGGRRHVQLPGPEGRGGIVRTRAALPPGWRVSRPRACCGEGAAGEGRRPADVSAEGEPAMTAAITRVRRAAI